MKHLILIKPLSVNECYRGQRFRTPAYKRYHDNLMVLLPRLDLPPPPYEIYFCFGFSSSASDWDNCIKTTQDLISERYGFNDKLIRRAVIETEITKKGQEFFEFELRHYEGKRGWQS